MEQGTTFTATDNPLVDFDGVCQKVRTALEPARAHAISLHDEHGELIWLSESSMGPDEHNAVRDALEAFAKPGGPAVLAYDLGDAHSAVLLRVVNTHKVLAGAIMAIVDTRIIKQDVRGAARLLTPKLQRVLGEFAEMRTGSEPALSPGASALVKISAPPQTQKKNPVPPPISPEIDRLHAALRRSPIALHVQRLIPLTKGSSLQRYEVLLRSKSDIAPNAAPQAMLKAAVENGLGSMIDRRVLTELIGWLVRHPAIWQDNGIMFSVNLTMTALHDEHFIKFVELCLAKASLPKGTIAFEIDVPNAIKLGARTTTVAVALNKLGCPLVLDDFALRTECIDLLRLPGVRYIKLAPAITAQMRTDKLSQAAITAMVQMARVLGMFTVAKRTESAAEREWLTALGVDFIQSNKVEPPVAIESLTHL